MTLYSLKALSSPTGEQVWLRRETKILYDVVIFAVYKVEDGSSNLNDGRLLSDWISYRMQTMFYWDCLLLSSLSLFYVTTMLVSLCCS